MRKIYSIIMIAFVFAACGEGGNQSVEDVIATNDLKKIREKKTELNQEQKELSDQIKEINKAIEELDTLKRNPLITAITLKNEEFVHYIELQGNVKTKQNVLIYPEMPGLLERVYVDEGDKVYKGQLLATIDDGGMQQQLAQAKATAQLAKTTYERQKRLWEQKIGSEIQYLQAETNYLATKNTVEQLSKQLGKFRITAPFSGVIDDVIKDQGTIVAPGQGSEIFRIVNLENMYLEADIPESYISSVTKGRDVVVEFPVLGTTVDTKVRQTGNFINPNNRTFKAEIGVPNKEGNIKPNLTAKLKINDYISEEAILIPQSIISENAAGDQYVYKVINLEGNVGIAKQVVVKTGKTQGDIIEVLEGVSPGDLLIEEGARSVKDGQEVEITEKS
jgi:RND family efflux transporter MFP subunit